MPSYNQALKDLHSEVVESIQLVARSNSREREAMAMKAVYQAFQYFYSTDYVLIKGSLQREKDKEALEEQRYQDGDW